MLIDTHAHIYLDAFNEDLDAVLTRAKDAGVDRIVMPAIDVPSIERALELCSRHEGLFAMAALHPSETNEATDADFDRVRALCAEDRIVAVGETGLDYYWDRSFDEKQQDFLRRHIRLAAEVDLPLVFHNREATEDLLAVLSDERERLDDAARCRGIFHCFSGPADAAEGILDLGFHVGIGGTLTFKNARVGEAIEEIPLERIVLETDAPFLTPAPHRGKRNEPAYVRLVAERLAELRSVSVDHVAETTTRVARALFGI